MSLTGKILPIAGSGGVSTIRSGFPHNMSAPTASWTESKYHHPLKIYAGHQLSLHCALPSMSQSARSAKHRMIRRALRVSISWRNKIQQSEKHVTYMHVCARCTVLCPGVGSSASLHEDEDAIAGHENCSRYWCSHWMPNRGPGSLQRQGEKT